MHATEVYSELDAARIEVEFLAATNSVSLNTPEKRLAWDVAYDRAKARLYRAQAARNDLVQRMVSAPQSAGLL